MSQTTNSAPMFSVVIPTFNRSRLVAYAVDSILRQTFGDLEVVVCDNCSIDDTPDVIGRIPDPRVRYVRTPAHGPIAESWEFARSQARGRFVVMLSDDDALVPTALEAFAREITGRQADFLFCGVVEYRDQTFPGVGRNTVSCPRFSGASRVVTTGEFLQPLFGFKGRFDMHPSAFVFARGLADAVASRCGRFFQTNGVEYCAWTLAAALARRIVFIDAPLCICGRTGKSWGSNLRLANPGQALIEQFISDVEREPKCAPLRNFTMCNLWGDGVLTARKLLPLELGGYEFDEPRYLRGTIVELADRRAMGVDVAREMREALEYSRRWPSLERELVALSQRREPRWRSAIPHFALSAAGSLKRSLRARRAARRVKQGDVRSGFVVRGADFGFDGIIGCAEFLRGVVARAGSASG
jgi:glycosyltransferase involved in cell wall biosynthesis